MKKEDLFKFLSQYVTPHKLELFEKVLAFRTRYITVVLEDIFQSQNASAVLRSCDCFGVQDVHIVENNNEYRVNPHVSLGASKWLTLSKYNEKKDNTKDCLLHLKDNGYRIIATTPHNQSQKLEDLNLESGKMALLFGTEKEGLSKSALEMADEFVYIPMKGFTESLNISVSAALCLYTLTQRMHDSDIPWGLNEDEKSSLRESWAKKVVNNPDALERYFLKNFYI